MIKKKEWDMDHELTFLRLENHEQKARIEEVEITARLEEFDHLSISEQWNIESETLTPFEF